MSDQVTVTDNPSNEDDAELLAMQKVYSALKPLPADGQQRVLKYVSERLNLAVDLPEKRRTREDFREDIPDRSEAPPARDSEAIADMNTGGDSDGINPVAQKWLRRNGIQTANIESIFSLTGDEIDLISESVPGDSKRARVRSVVLLTSAAAYLASGAARVSDEKLREILRHYDAYDRPNFATHLKDLAAEVSGTKEHGYSLTPRGLAAAAQLLKQMAKDGEK